MGTKELNIKKARFDTHLLEEQKLLFERAAAIGGYRNLSDFIIPSVLDRAKGIIKERELILAPERDSEIFFNALMKETSPNETLVSAVADYNKLSKR